MTESAGGEEKSIVKTNAGSEDHGDILETYCHIACRLSDWRDVSTVVTRGNMKERVEQTQLIINTKYQLSVADFQF